MEQEALVDSVTRMIMERLNGGGSPASGASVVTFGDVPASLLGPGVAVRQGRTPSDVDGAQYIVLTQEAFRVLHGGVAPVALGGVASLAASPTPAAASCCGGGDSFVLTGKKLISDRDVRTLGLTSGSTLRVDPGAVITALARDYATSVGAKIIR